MKVKVMNRLYQMSQKEYQGLLQVAKEQVPLGIYAIEKQGYAELRCDKCSSVTQRRDSMCMQIRECICQKEARLERKGR